MSKVLELNGIVKNFTQGGEKISVLDSIKMSVKKGEIVALVGPSGSGKTTLLQIAGLLDNPNEGTVTIDGNTATITGTHPNYNATFNMGAGNEGVLAYTINLIDSAGNTNVTYTSVTDGTSVIFDRTDPTSAVRTIASNNVNFTNLAKANDDVHTHTHPKQLWGSRRHTAYGPSPVG